MFFISSIPETLGYFSSWSEIRPTILALQETAGLRSDRDSYVCRFNICTLDGAGKDLQILFLKCPCYLNFMLTVLLCPIVFPIKLIS